MKRRDPVLLGDVMRQFLDPAALDDNANQQRLVAFWPDVVGEYINRQTVRRWIKDRVLHVVIVSAPLRNELMLNRSHLVKRLNEITGADVISDIVSTENKNETAARKMSLRLVKFFVTSAYS